MDESSLVIFLIAGALGYVLAFVGGFTDAANAIATSVGSRVLSPRAAVVMAGIFNLLGGLTGTAVATTIGKGLVDPAVLSLFTVIAGLARGYVLESRDLFFWNTCQRNSRTDWRINRSSD